MNNKVLFGILGAIAVVGIAAGAYVYTQNQNDETADTSTTSGDTSQQTSAAQDDQASEQPVGNTSYKSEKGVSMTIGSPLVDTAVASPLKVEGTVPGSWSHEGQFTVRLLDADSSVLAEGVAKIDGDWMSSNNVPFSATLTFDAPASGSTGLLVLEKANPSGLEDNADSLSMLIHF